MEDVLSVLNWISEKVMVKEVVGPILVVCISILINGMIKNVVHRFFHIDKKKLKTKEEKRTITVVSLITNIIKYVIILIDVIIILGIYGIPTASIIASLGAVGVVLGLALQDTLKDFVSGFFIITDNLYRMGDWIEIGDFEGEVISIGLKTTQIRAYTGEVKIISNRTVTEVINYNLSNIDDAKWEIVDDGQGNIETIRMFFFNNSSDTSATYYIASVTPKVDITINDLLDPDKTVLDQAFDTNNYFGALYSRDYSFSFDPSIQDTRSELRDAVNTKAANDGIIDRVDSNTLSIIKDNGGRLDTTLEGTSRAIVILNINENGYEEYTVQIKENQTNNSDKTLIDNLNNNQYYEVELEHRENTFSSNFIENQNLPENTAGSVSYKFVVTNENGEDEEYYV